MSTERVNVYETSQEVFSPAASVPGVRFVHTATADNSGGNTTLIDHPLINGNPDAIVLVTQNWNPGGPNAIGTWVYNPHPISVYYESGAYKWGIANLDVAEMPVGADFNVLIPTPDTSVFIHTATAGNFWEPYLYRPSPHQQQP